MKTAKDNVEQELAIEQHKYFFIGAGAMAISVLVVWGFYALMNSFVCS